MADHPKLLLVDGHALLYRAFYALPDLRNSRGEPIGALHGFIKTTRKYISDHQPTHFAVAFDLGAPSRLKDLPTYKSQRPETPDNLRQQIPFIKDWLAANRIPALERSGDEADDIIATVAAAASHRDWQTLIATNDKDIAQLVTDTVAILRPALQKGSPDVIMGAAAICERFGVTPAQIVDYLSLIGDTSDNIPGVVGVGPKTAADLLRRFGDIETLLQRLDEIARPLVRENLKASVELLRRNRALITLRSNLPLEYSLDELKISKPDYALLIFFLERMEMKSLLAEAQKAAQESQPTLL